MDPEGTVHSYSTRGERILPGFGKQKTANDSPEIAGSTDALVGGGAGARDKNKPIHNYNCTVLPFL